MKPTERRDARVNEEHRQKWTTEVQEHLADERKLLLVRSTKVGSISVEAAVERDGAFMNARGRESKRCPGE
jgi:hypothetical protein